MEENKNWWKRGVDAIVDSVGYAFIRTSPLTGPLPSIYVLLSTASGWKSLLIVVGVELIGYAVGDTAVKAIKRKVLPERIIVYGIIAYLATIEGLMLGYNVIPAWTSWYAGTVNVADAIRASVSVLYPFFTLAGAGLFAFYEFMQEGENKLKQADQVQIDEKKAEAEAKRQRRQQEWEDDRSHKLRLREIELGKLQAEQSAAKSAAKSAIESASSQSTADADRRLQLAMLDGYLKNNGLSDEKMALAIGTSKIKTQQLLADLAAKGVVDIVRIGKGKQVTLNGKSEAFRKGEEL